MGSILRYNVDFSNQQKCNFIILIFISGGGVAIAPFLSPLDVLTYALYHSCFIDPTHSLIYCELLYLNLGVPLIQHISFMQSLYNRQIQAT